ncbi:hypothetical protein AAH092_16975, partial [Bacteroides xylanisolvens]|uniref:hypothetical protein n=1 Tax=Bacteroides xylanisolvens TaxID=371601 RepID=UPI0039B5C4D5
MTKKNDLTKMFIHTANIVRKPKKQKPKTYIRSIKIILPSSLLIIVQKNTLLVQKNHHYSTTSYVRFWFLFFWFSNYIRSVQAGHGDARSLRYLTVRQGGVAVEPQ